MILSDDASKGPGCDVQLHGGIGACEFQSEGAARQQPNGLPSVTTALERMSSLGSAGH